MKYGKRGDVIIDPGIVLTTFGDSSFEYGESASGFHQATVATVSTLDCLVRLHIRLVRTESSWFTKSHQRFISPPPFEPVDLVVGAQATTNRGYTQSFGTEKKKTPKIVPNLPFCAELRPNGVDGFVWLSFNMQSLF